MQKRIADNAKHRSTILFLAAIFLLIASELCVNSSIADFDNSKPWKVNVDLKSEIYLPTPRFLQDVFIVLNDTLPEEIYRIGRKDAEKPKNMARQIFGASKSITHDFNASSPYPLEPDSKGRNLNITLRQWLAGTGTGTYVERNNNATMDLTFHKMIPNGVYSVWCTLISIPPNFREQYIPIGAIDGSQNIYKTNSNGEGVFNIDINALPPSTNIANAERLELDQKDSQVKDQIEYNITGSNTQTFITVVYHSDGLTNGPIPGEFGKTSHVQLVYLMYPKPRPTSEDLITLENSLLESGPLEFNNTEFLREKGEAALKAYSQKI
jgi:hypothetical protein